MQMWQNLEAKKGTGWSNLMVHIRTQHETTPSGPQNTLDFMQCKKSQKRFRGKRFGEKEERYQTDEIHSLLIHFADI